MSRRYTLAHLLPLIIKPVETGTENLTFPTPYLPFRKISTSIDRFSFIIWSSSVSVHSFSHDFYISSCYLVCLYFLLLYFLPLLNIPALFVYFLLLPSFCTRCRFEVTFHKIAVFWQDEAWYKISLFVAKCNYLLVFRCVL